MSLYVPPHRKTDDQSKAEELTDMTSEAYQQAAWQALRRTLTGIINRLSGENLADSATQLFRENLIRGRGLFARCLFRAQQADPELTLLLSSLASRINKEFPHVVFLLCKRLVAQWRRTYLRKDWQSLENISRFLAGLYIFNVVEVDIIYQIILEHLGSETRGEEDIDQAAKLFRATFRAMSERARGEFHEQVLTPFRDFLAMDDDSARLSARAEAVLESCLKEVQKWERAKDEVSVIPENLLLIDLNAQTTHALNLEEKYAPEDHLDRYAFDSAYVEHEETYEVARKAILGENWEMELLERAAIAEEEDSQDETDEEDAKGNDIEPGKSFANAKERHPPNKEATAQRALDSSKPVISNEQRQLRKEVYLAICSSVRADEAVHKILKQMKSGTERTVCFMVIEGCCEEKSYRKMYAMAAERLCKSKTHFQTFFIEAFLERYIDAEDLTLKQIEYTCKIYTHLLRTNSLYWHRCLGVMDILYNNESQRLFINFLLQGLMEEMGDQALRKRLEADSELAFYIRKLFPVEQDAASLETAINLYAAMGLSYLTTPMRLALEKRRGSERKRSRVEDDREYV
ncbi:unnamed protein product [Phytomonas sp. Hart1]|nr:unnamed protein product [Phytomonas sp. Hart1]|eukprot:CCW69934.1 unnamed protein product [Phytomonas sp. isolate Hart1]